MGPARCGIVVFQQRGSNTALAQIATPPELRCTALRGMEFAKSRLDGTVTEHELTNTATVVIAIITVCDTLSVVASLEFGIMAVSYSMFVFGNVVMMVALALDEPEPWYILYVILLSSCYHWNHLIENAFTHKLSPKWPCEIGGRTTARVPTLPGWTGGLCSTRLGWSIALVPFVGIFMACIAAGTTTCALCPSTQQTIPQNTVLTPWASTVPRATTPFPSAPTPASRLGSP